MTIVETQLPVLHDRAVLAWEKYQAIKAEKRKLQARLDELDKVQKELDKLLSTQFPHGHGRRLMKNGIFLERKVIPVPALIVTADMFGDVVRKGYSYAQYKEVKV